MGFQIIKAEDRYLSMKTWFTGMCALITDWTVGSKLRTKLETVAVEMEAQDYAFEQAIRAAIPVSVYQTFGFSLNPAVRATGNVVFTANSAPASNIQILKGTRVATTSTDLIPEKLYEVVADAVLLSGQTTATVSVIAVETGAIGNTPSGTINVIKNSIVGIDSVNNTAGLTNGTDKESDEARRLRFQSYIQTLTRSIGAAIEYGAKTAALYDVNGIITEQVTKAKVVEPYLPKAITGITQANPAVATCLQNGIPNDTQIIITTVAGMTQVNSNTYTVKNRTVDSFQLYNQAGNAAIDSTGYSAYTSGGIATPQIAAGQCTCYVDNGTGTASADLRTRSQNVVDGYYEADGTIVPGYKAAGVVCTVTAVTAVATNVTAAVTAYSYLTADQKTALDTAITTAITDYIHTLNMGDKLIRSKIIEVIMSQEGAYNCTLSAPASDTTPDIGQIITAGTINVTVL